MGTKRVTLRTKRYFSDEFKKTLVKEYEKGKFSVQELSHLHQIDRHILYQWIHKHSTYYKSRVMVVEMSESSTRKLKDMEQRIKELERIVGQKQIKIEYLEKMIDLASEKHDIDIKKNFDTPQSSGSGTIGTE